MFTCKSKKLLKLLRLFDFSDTSKSICVLTVDFSVLYDKIRERVEEISLLVEVNRFKFLLKCVHSPICYLIVSIRTFILINHCFSNCLLMKYLCFSRCSIWYVWTKELSKLIYSLKIFTENTFISIRVPILRI